MGERRSRPFPPRPAGQGGAVFATGAKPPIHLPIVPGIYYAWAIFFLTYRIISYSVSVLIRDT
jgi:hypothetical protein